MAIKLLRWHFLLGERLANTKTGGMVYNDEEDLQKEIPFSQHELTSRCIKATCSFFFILLYYYLRLFYFFFAHITFFFNLLNQNVTEINFLGGDIFTNASVREVSVFSSVKKRKLHINVCACAGYRNFEVQVFCFTDLYGRYLIIRFTSALDTTPEISTHPSKKNQYFFKLADASGVIEFLTYSVRVCKYIGLENICFQKQKNDTHIKVFPSSFNSLTIVRLITFSYIKKVN